MNLEEKLKQDIYEILKEYISYEDIVIEKPKVRSMGDYAIPCFVYSKQLKKSPNDIALFIKDKLTNYKIEVLNGYVNVFIDRKDYTGKLLDKIIDEKENYGNSNIGDDKIVVLEYSSPNIAKPFSVGHLRSTVIGEALKNINIKTGYKVYTINYLGDYGTQFGKLIYAYKTWGNEEEVRKNPIAELKKLYVKFHELASLDPTLDDEGRNWFKKLSLNDKEAVELWSWFKEESLKDFQRTYDLLGINKFDSYDGEYKYKDLSNDVVKMIEEKGISKISDGATIVDLGDDKTPALIKKSDGTTLYITRDIAALLDRKQKYNFDEILYIVGSEQTLHFEQLKDVIDKMGYDFSDKIKHIGFGLVLQDGKKMSTRAGKTASLNALLNNSIDLAKDIIESKNPNLQNKEEIAKQVGVGAVIFNDLKNYRLNDIEFKLEDILKFEGSTGPYVQYTHARINSLIKNIRNIDINYDNININDNEWYVIFKLGEFEKIVVKSKVNYDPSLLAKYMIDLAQEFNKLYSNYKFVDEDKNLSEYRLKIAMCSGIVLKEGMRLLGISMPDEM
ncbi:MAG: arginine--tRNA ligase [Clostridium sp.]|nr:arginine--tRNA ligase [Clostridium sp.]MCM1444536.1 arginine--tRNA ligase [Candidatus Amulumruptor caecigallinarius]